MFPKVYYFSEMSVSRASQKGSPCTKVCSASTHQQQEGAADTPEEHRNTDLENS